eukprot:4172517-Pyramimonas_sp.AAC.1
MIDGSSASKLKESVERVPLPSSPSAVLLEARCLSVRRLGQTVFLSPKWSPLIDQRVLPH